MDNEIKLTSSMEDYLEAILLLERKHRGRAYQGDI